MQLRLAFLTLGLSLATASEPAPPPRALRTDVFNEPLPSGAKARLGGSAPDFWLAPHGTLLPPEYNTFAVPLLQGGVRRFDAKTGRPFDAIKPHDGYSAWKMVVSTDGARIVTVRSDTLFVTDITKGVIVQKIKPTTGAPPDLSTVSVTHDGKLLAQGGSSQMKEPNGEVVVWDVD